MLQAEFARGDQICPEKSVELEMAAEMCAVQFFDQFAKPLSRVDICGGRVYGCPANVFNTEVINV